MTEDLIETALARIYETRTVIAIAHRLSTIRRADRIVVLDGGEAAETGAHAELVRRGGPLRPPPRRPHGGRRPAGGRRLSRS